jgi:hypothetical protein
MGDEPMARGTLAESKPFTEAGIVELGSTAGPWVTVLLRADLPGSAARGLPARLRAAAVQAEEKLNDRGEPDALIRRLTGAIPGIAARLEDEKSGKTLAVFASGREVRHYWLEYALPDSTVVADNIYIRPVLEHLGGEPFFFLLALDQKKIRLLRCTGHDLREVNLPADVPASLLEFTAADRPDHVLDNRAASGAWRESAVVFGTGSEREAHPEYLLHFYKEVSHGISQLLRGQEKTPLVVCGVESELALFERVNTWQNTCPAGVRGAANSFKGAELRERALECLKRMAERKLDEVVAQHDRQAGEAATAGVDDIVKAAYEGRVLRLLAARNARAMGSFDHPAHRARTRAVAKAGDEDLINAAAVQTIVHGGEVHLMPQARVPGNRPMAAVMRY